MQPSMGWPRLDPTLANRSSATSAPYANAADFLNWAARESATDDIFEQFIGERTWAVPSLEQFFKTAHATRAAIAFKGGISLIEGGFRCFLMKPLIFATQTRAPKAKGNALGTVDQSVSLWNDRVAQAANTFGVAMEPEDEKSMWSEVFAQDYSNWMELEAIALPSRVKRPGETEPKLYDRVGIYVVSKLGAKPTPLLRAVAKRAFLRQSTPQMKSLGTRVEGFEWPRAKPRQELDVCTVRMSHILTAATDLELGVTIVDWKGAKISKPRWSSVFTNWSMTIVADLLERDKAADVQKSVSRLEDAAKQRDEACFTLHPDKQSKAKLRTTLVGTAGVAPLPREEATVYLPKCVGVAFDNDTTVLLHWKVSYPNASAPLALSKVWSAKTSDLLVTIGCIAWAWEGHWRVPGEKRP